MSISETFIRRPVATTLLALALLLVGAVAFLFLPVASLPPIEFPTIVITAQRPGADPETMAATVAAPLERRLSEIAGVTEMTSTSALGSTSITVQFDLNKNIDSGARAVQAAVNAAAADLPRDLPVPPFYRKVNQASLPVLVIALTSETLPTSTIYDAADTVLVQRISEVSGVAQVIIAGSEQPAIRVQVDPARLASMGLGVNTVAKAIAAANAQSPIGSLEGASQSITLADTDQLSKVREFRNIIIEKVNGAIVKLGDVANVTRGVRNRYAAGWLNRKPAVLLIITKQASANVIETTEQIKALLPQLQRWIPSGIDITILSDRTQTIRVSVADIKRTLFLSICLVMVVVFLFLRRGTPTLAAGVTVPLSLVGTGAALWITGISVDNMSLMALTIAVGFVVDDAIVMIETIEHNIERGMQRIDAAIAGARQIGFTVVSMTFSLLAVFIPLYFMGGATGQLLREFAMTLGFAIIISMIVSLTVTPMICAHLSTTQSSRRSRFDKSMEGLVTGAARLYAMTLRPVIDHPWPTLLIIIGAIAYTARLYQEIPKETLPQDDIGLINGTAEASPDVSFDEMVRLMRQGVDVLLSDPDVANVGSFTGTSNLSSPPNQGRLYVALKPPAERKSTSLEVIARLRAQFAKVAGLQVYMVPSQDLRTGARISKAQYQYALTDFSLSELDMWEPKILEAMRKLPELADVTSDREAGALRAKLVIDRNAASRMNVSVAAIDTALNNAFGQFEDSIMYTQRNQYRVVFEVSPARQKSPEDLASLYVSAAGGTQVPLAAVVHIERSASPIVVNHQGVVPAATISYNLAPGVSFGSAAEAVRRTVTDLDIPVGLRADFAGEAGDSLKVIAAMVYLILAALLAIYIILGILYESYIHPLTIISTLPSAGLGALLSLKFLDIQFTVVAFIGILLLMGIVKKNGIMLVDFALDAERERGLSSREAALEAATERFRPIVMTTLSAIFGALPLALATGIGAEMRRPLGIAIVGGLLLSQMLTLYTTPVIYIVMSKLASMAVFPAKAPSKPTLVR